MNKDTEITLTMFAEALSDAVEALNEINDNLRSLNQIIQFKN